MFQGWGVIGDFILATLLTLGFAVTCVPGQVQLDESKVDGQIEIARGQSLVLTLDSNPTTGYRWEIAEMNTNVLRQEGDAVLELSDAGNSSLVGAGGTESFHFAGVGAGKTNLKLIYHRAWEKNVQPIKTYVVQVTVR
jgi:inhibitor of cysteine peptidase